MLRIGFLSYPPGELIPPHGNIRPRHYERRGTDGHGDPPVTADKMDKSPALRPVGIRAGCCFVVAVDMGGFGHIVVVGGTRVYPEPVPRMDSGDAKRRDGLSSLPATRPAAVAMLCIERSLAKLGDRRRTWG